MIRLVCWGQYDYQIKIDEVTYFTLNVKDHWAPWWPSSDLLWPEKIIDINTDQFD